jgi:uncharacterized membrane protein
MPGYFLFPIPPEQLPATAVYTSTMDRLKTSSENHFVRGLRDSMVVILAVSLVLSLMYVFY